MKYILDDDGNPVECADTETWARWVESNFQRRIVARTQVGRATVSTVFLAIDHEFGDGPPLLYETMVFTGDPQTGDHDWRPEQRRYATRDAALDGHAEVCEEVRAWQQTEGNI